jgi:hypothetical protein
VYSTTKQKNVGILSKKFLESANLGTPNKKKMSTNIEFVPDFSLDPVYFADWLLRHDENNLYHQYESVKTNMHGTDVVGMANVRIDVRKDENGSLIYFPRGSQ